MAPAENRILRGQIKGRLLLSEGEKATLAEIGHRLCRRALEDMAATTKPDTILGWYRKLVANKFDGSKFRLLPLNPITRTLCLFLQRGELRKDVSGVAHPKFGAILPFSVAPSLRQICSAGSTQWNVIPLLICYNKLSIGPRKSNTEI
jgi:hypothetical protein